jgi:hypothetical protein
MVGGVGEGGGGEDGHTSTTFEYLNIQITFDSKELRKNNDGGDKNMIWQNAAITSC